MEIAPKANDSCEPLSHRRRGARLRLGAATVPSPEISGQSSGVRKRRNQPPGLDRHASTA